jgi:hypothetical protein
MQTEKMTDFLLPLVDIHFSLNGSEIEIVNEFNYLGILLNRTGNFNKAITKQAEKAKQAMYEVLKLVSMILISIVIYKIVIVFFPDNQYFYYIPKFPTHKEV